MTREGGGCGDGGSCEDDGGCDAIVDVDAEKEDGGAYGGDSDVCDCPSGDGTVGEDRFDPDRSGQVVESLFFSLFVGLSSLGRRVLPLTAVTMVGEDRNADGAMDPEADGTGLSVATTPLQEAFDADIGVVGMVSVRVEDSLDDGELEDRPLACRELSEDPRERLDLGTLGKGSAGGGELEPRTLLVSVEEAAVDGDLEDFEGVGDDDDRVAVIDCPGAEGAGNLAPIDEPAVDAVGIRESEAARALSLDGTTAFESWTVIGAALGTTSHEACFVLDTAVPGSGCFPPGVSEGFSALCRGGLTRFADE